MKTLAISKKVKEKLRIRHKVAPAEVQECFVHATFRCLRRLIDTREQHRTDPPTLWMLSRTANHRLLKLVFMVFDDRIELKSAFEPNEDERRIYAKVTKTKV